MRVYPAIDIRFTPEAEDASALCDRLLAGLDDFQPTAIEESSSAWRVFFEAAGARDRAVDWLRQTADPRITIAALDVDDEDWARRTQADLQPVRVGRIVVTPPWSADEVRRSAGPTDLAIVIVPSTGFGTAHHASTRLCLALLQETNVRGRRVLDIGTGSAVLAIAAARLGAASVVALDNDADAIEAARENIAINGVGPSIHLEQADFRTVAHLRADIVVANLTGELLRRAADLVVRCMASGGEAILSGVLVEEQASVVGAFEAAGARLQSVTTDDEWVGLRFTGRTS